MTWFWNLKYRLIIAGCIVAIIGLILLIVHPGLVIAYVVIIVGIIVFVIGLIWTLKAKLSDTSTK